MTTGQPPVAVCDRPGCTEPVHITMEAAGRKVRLCSPHWDEAMKHIMRKLREGGE